MDDQAFAVGKEVSRLNTLIAERQRELESATDEAKGLLLIASKGSEMALPMALQAEASAKAIAANIVALKTQREAAKGRVDAKAHLRRVADIRGKLDTDINTRLKVLQAFHTILENVTFQNDGTVIIKSVAGAFMMALDRDGKVLKGSAMLTTDEAAMGRFDTKVVDILQAVTKRFVLAHKDGPTNWAMLGS